VLNALVAAKLAAQKQCSVAFLQSFRQGGLLGVEAGSAQQLEAYVNELKSIATQCPAIDVLKQKVRQAKVYQLSHFISNYGTQ
jgi:hypothetical protein